MNRVELVGRLTKDVEVRKTQSGLSVASFAVACDRMVSKEDREKGAVTADFIDCIAWRGSADYLGSYGGKGDWIAVEGKLQKRKWEDKSGHTQYATEVVCENVKLLKSSQKQPVQDQEQTAVNNSQWLDINADDMP